MTELEAKKVKIRELLKCPIDWERIVTRLGILNLMEEYWGEFVQAYEVDHEGGYVRDDLFLSGTDLDGEEDEEYLDWQIRNIETWIEQARKDYIEQTRRFAQLKMADRNIYPKHFPNPSWTYERVQRQSSSGVSIFYSDVSVDDLMDLVWESLPCLCSGECAENLIECDGPWRKMLQVSQLKIYVQAERAIGATYGKATEYVCLDFDCNTPVVHAYPISKDEIVSEKILAPHTYPKTWKDIYIG